MKKEVVHTRESDAIGNREIVFAGMFSSYNAVWVTYYSFKTEHGYSFGILCKPRQTPLTAKQWNRRVKDIQSKAEWNKVRNSASETISKAVQVSLQLSKPILKK